MNWKLEDQGPPPDRLTSVPCGLHSAIGLGHIQSGAQILREWTRSWGSPKPLLRACPSSVPSHNPVQIPGVRKWLSLCDSRSCKMAWPLLWPTALILDQEQCSLERELCVTQNNRRRATARHDFHEDCCEVTQCLHYSASAPAFPCTARHASQSRQLGGMWKVAGGGRGHCRVSMYVHPCHLQFGPSTQASLGCPGILHFFALSNALFLFPPERFQVHQ